MQTRVTPDGYTRIDDLLRLLECNACGAVVNSPGRHDEWHDGLIARLAEIERGEREWLDGGPTPAAHHPRIDRAGHREWPVGCRHYADFACASCAAT